MWRYHGDLTYRRYPPKFDRSTIAIAVIIIVLIAIGIYRIVS